MTLAFLENQLASALTLASAAEYRHWLIIYTRFLVNEGESGMPSVWTQTQGHGGLLSLCLENTQTRYHVNKSNIVYSVQYTVYSEKDSLNPNAQPPPFSPEPFEDLGGMNQTIMRSIRSP